MSEPLQGIVTRNTRVLMAIRGITEYRELAKLLGVDATTVSNKMRGTRKWSLEDIEKLADAFHLAPASLLGDVQSIVDPRDGDTATIGANNRWSSSLIRVSPRVLPAASEEAHTAIILPFDRNKISQKTRAYSSRSSARNNRRLIG